MILVVSLGVVHTGQGQAHKRTEIILILMKCQRKVETQKK